ncbi:hypothetical protein Misp01_80600 [Microtetraspora sp. NBRC 13810]|uniref:hypothetical protein n=1 Tax=Microtetraspora sp. NBRC 13810 TaxID=3030990 RepID=UPI0024A2AABB|nr:hypothetical protein [Microtetraspora sp. NBRC 13810]GLW12932.1 hypothetical protein Misp01_80600 [Microtetraspora sp. NBRC 13810]
MSTALRLLQAYTTAGFPAAYDDDEMLQVLLNGAERLPADTPGNTVITDILRTAQSAYGTCKPVPGVDTSCTTTATFNPFGNQVSWLVPVPQWEWTEFLHTDRTKLKLKPSTGYTLTYRYRILGPADTRVQNYFLARSTAAGHAGDVWGGEWAEPTGSGVKTRTINFTTGPQEDYYLIWGIHVPGGAAAGDQRAMAVDNIVLNGPVG